MRYFDFMRYRKATLAFSLLLVVFAIGSLATRPINWGLDFTGGTLLEIQFESTVNLEQVRETIRDTGYENAVVVSFGTDRDILIRLPRDAPETAGTDLTRSLQRAVTQQLELTRQEFVGPQVGNELREQGGLAMLLACGLIMVYISFRFQARFAVAAIAALAHDVIITLGFLTLIGAEFNLTVLAAILAVIGYSINDTIVVFDRIRENFRKLRNTSVLDTVNVSLAETLGRTFVTSLTTLLVLVALAVFGGEMIQGFAYALLAGVVVGTYSSMFVASSLIIMMGVTASDLIPPPVADEFDGPPD